MQVTTIIVNWQRPHDTIECINSVRASQITNHNILVIDNGSEDDSVQIITDAFPDIELVVLPQNQGFSGGYNAGIQHVLDQHAATHLFLLNNDTIIKPNTISELLASAWDVAVPKIFYYADSQRIWAAGSKWRWLPPSVKMIGYRKLDHPRYQIERRIDYATGCALFISQQVAKSVGGFDPLFKNYMEDYDFSFRVKQAGFSIGYVPTAMVYHKVSQSLGANSPHKWYYIGRNTFLFYRKNGRFPYWMVAAFVSWVTCREFFKGNWRILRSYWEGIRAGFKLVR